MRLIRTLAVLLALVASFTFSVPPALAASPLRGPTSMHLTGVKAPAAGLITYQEAPDPTAFDAGVAAAALAAGQGTGPTANPPYASGVTALTQTYPTNCHDSLGQAYIGDISQTNPNANMDGVHGTTAMHPLYPCLNPTGYDALDWLGVSVDYMDAVHIAQIGLFKYGTGPYYIVYTLNDHDDGGVSVWPGSFSYSWGDRVEFSVWHDPSGNWLYYLKNDRTGIVQEYLAAATFTSTGSSGYIWWGFETHDDHSVMDTQTSQGVYALYSNTYRPVGGSWAWPCNATLFPWSGFPPLPSWYHETQARWHCTSGTGDELWVKTD